MALQIYAQKIPQKGYEYSKKPMEIMGCTRTSTISQVKKQLNSWGISFTTGEDWVQIENVKWYGIHFNVINFVFDKKGKIKWISSRSNTISKDALMYEFWEIVGDLPYRGLYSDKYNTPYYIHNGVDDSEFAVLSFLLGFWFFFNNTAHEGLGFQP